MRFDTSVICLLASAKLIGALELPITTADVFIQSGEISESSVNIMTRCNNEIDSKVKLTMDGAVIQESQAFAARDYTITFKVEGLESNTEYTYSTECISHADESISVSSVGGSFKTAPAADDAVAVDFVWAADLAGQGYGRNPDFELTNASGEQVKGGYIVFDTMEALEPDFALFQGDMIYADGPIPKVKEYTNGTEVLGVWMNNPSKDFDAVTLDEFRHNWKYNFGDEKMASFLAKTPIFVQWDDHEVTNNWYPGEIMGPTKYEEGTSVNSLFANSLQAFYEFNPIMEGSKIYRSQRFGKHLEIFFPDYRSYRDPNPDNDNEEKATMLGEEQLEWLKNGLKTSTATWKIISSHDPFGIVTGGDGDRDSWGNQKPEILGREFEMKEILEVIHQNHITGVVSISSDVHFTAHVNMSPERAEGGFTDFTPLDEFVIGPIHAGSFGPNYMDTSFGAQYEYEMGPLTLGYERWANLAPTITDLQSFGHASVSENGTLVIKLIGIDGYVKFEKTLEPEEHDHDHDKPPADESTANDSKASLAFYVILALAFFN